MHDPEAVDSEGVIFFNVGGDVTQVEREGNRFPQSPIQQDTSSSHLSDVNQTRQKEVITSDQYTPCSSQSATQQGEAHDDLRSVLKAVVTELQQLKLTAGARQRQNDDGNAGHTAPTRDRRCPGEIQYNKDAGDHHNQTRHASDRQFSHTHSQSPVTHSIKIRAFTGKEDWEMWIARFEAIANRCRWSEDDKLLHLLPRLEGEAADFAFVQLPSSVVDEYDILIPEMDHRFRSIETARSRAAKFNRRRQKPDERIEDYAADLKNLYDRAYKYRDKRTRGEDLLHHF